MYMKELRIYYIIFNVKLKSEFLSNFIFSKYIFKYFYERNISLKIIYFTYNLYTYLIYYNIL